MNKKVPPYLSYTTFRNFLDSLRATALPTRIDRGIMANMSGSNQALLLSTIRYLGLASEQGIPTADLKQLIDAKEPERRHVWKRIVMKGYSDLFGVKLDLERTTTDELAEVFRRHGVTSPERIRKCVSFFTLAAKDADIKLSPHIKPYAGRRQAKRQTLAKSADAESKASAAASSVPQNTGLIDWELPNFPDFDPTWPADVRNNWLEAFGRLLVIRRDTQKG